MRKSLAISLIVLFLSPSCVVFAQDENEETPRNGSYLSIDVMKPLFWFMRDQGFVLEPQFNYQSKGVIYNVVVGYSNISGEIYNHEIDYSNTGQYLKLGIGFQLNYNADKYRRSKVILGGSLVFSGFEETGKIISSYSNWGITGDVNQQKNSARGMELFFAFQHEFDNDFFIHISPRISAAFNELNNDAFPVYYIPGYGIVSDSYGYSSFSSIFSDDDQGSTSVGLAVKLGYRF